MTLSSLLARPLNLPRDEDAPSVDATHSQDDFLFLIRAFFVSGGTARKEELERLLRERPGTPDQLLTTWVATRNILAFEWNQTIWIPMFQFELSELSLKLSARQVRAELEPFVSGWAQAWWFGQPHSRLDNRSPIDMLDLNLPAVLAAARADRLMAGLGKLTAVHGLTPHVAASDWPASSEAGLSRRTNVARLWTRGHH